jgi:SAM-dependent methyltransferase
MQFVQSLPRILGASGLAFALALNVAVAQQPAKDFTPQSGQPGKDVVWVPTPQALVDRMLEMGKVTANDYVVDLGSGDGRTVITAAKLGAKAKGIEYNPDMVELAKRNAEKEGMGGKAEFVRGDIFESNFSDATVITLFLLPSLNVRLRPILLDMKPGTRVVSNTFDMGDWESDDKIQATGECTSYCRAYLWIVPAKVAGTWKTGDGELVLEQKYQMLTGNLKKGNVIAPISAAKMNGDQITFTAAGTEYTGKVNGNKIEGVAKSGGGEAKFEATKS